MATDSNNYLIGNSVMSSAPTIVPASYQGVQWNGQGIIDNIVIRNIAQTDAQAETESIIDEPEWTSDVVFKTVFNYTTSSSNVTGLKDSQTEWQLCRQEVGGDVVTVVATVKPNVMSWLDWKAEGNQKYIYSLFANSATQISAPIISDEFDTTFFGYFMISNDADNMVDSNINQNVVSYKFDVNLESDKTMSNNDVTYLKNSSEFDICVIGNRNFRSGSFTTMILPIDPLTGEYDFMGETRWTTYLDNLRDFLHNKQSKIFKDYAGNCLSVISEGNGSTSDTKHSRGISVGEKFAKNNQEADVTIYWTQIGNV